MANTRKQIAPELIAMGKRLYEETDLPVREIAARMGMKRTTLNGRIDEWGWQRRQYSPATPPPAPARTSDAPAATPAAPTDEQLAFAARLQRVVDAQMAVIERTLTVLGPANSAEAERTTRILATISRTVQEIVATAQGSTTSNETDTDSVPRDMDAFRETLALRIRSFIEDEQRSAGADSGEAPERDVGSGP